MKIIKSAITILLPVLILVTMDVEGLGGMAGGRGGAVSRGASGGRSPGGKAQSINRSPSMSRVSSPKPHTVSRQLQQQRPQTVRQTPSINYQVRKPQNLQQRASGQTATREEVQQFLNQSGQNLPSKTERNRSSSDLRSSSSSKQSTQFSKEKMQELDSSRLSLGNQIRDQVGQNRPERSDWFNDKFWDEHGVRPPYYNQGNRNDWWKLATAAGISNWLRWDDYNPVYYDYYPYDNYWGVSDTSSTQLPPSDLETQSYAPSAESYQGGAAQNATSEWLPLGVFALSKEKGTQVSPNIYIQLALNQAGQISGTYYNTTLDAAYELEGVADKTTKLAAWKVVGNDNAPILETGIYNLTQDQVPVKVNFADGRSQQFLMIRLKQSQYN